MNPQNLKFLAQKIKEKIDFSEFLIFKKIDTEKLAV